VELSELNNGPLFTALKSENGPKSLLKQKLPEFMMQSVQVMPAVRALDPNVRADTVETKNTNIFYLL
jgi:hypothetical protein